MLDQGEIDKIWFLPTDEDYECRLARELKRKMDVGIIGFGCSDCDCDTHLFELGEAEKESKIIRSFAQLGDNLNPFSFEPSL